MSDLDLDEIAITGIDEYGATESVKLNGPPGTGKTTESAARVARLLDDEDTPYGPEDLLWATYRHSLAMETLERLAAWGIIPESELSDPADGVTRYISTIHAVGNRCIGGVGDVATWYDRKEFAKKRSLRFRKRNPWDEPGGELLFRVLDYAANNLIDVHEPAEREKIPMIDDLREKYPGSVPQAWDDWQAWKEANDKHDFWEMLSIPLQEGIGPDKRVVVIDEYHDATPLMAKLSEKWIAQAEVAIVAGDPLQVVNTYTGARPEFFNRLDLPEVLLDTTHRVFEESWAVATKVLGNAHTPPPVRRKRSGSFHDGPSPRFSYSAGRGWTVPDPDAPRSPAHIVEHYGTDTMFLTRTRRQAAGVARALEKAGILFEVQQSMDGIDGWGAKEDMSERTALYNALQRLADVQPAHGSRSGLLAYNDTDARTPTDVRFRGREAAALLDHTGHEYLTRSRGDVTTFVDDLDARPRVVHGDELEEHVTDEFWGVYTRGSGSVRHLNATASASAGSAIGDDDREALKAALARNDEPVRGVDTKVYTIHASKGSEAKNAVVYDGVTNRIAQSMTESERDRKNEYRTWYVALTRAHANLFVLRDGFDWMVPFLPESLIDTAKEANRAGVNA